MRKIAVAYSLFVFVSVALADGKIASSWTCAKPTKENKLEVTDEPDHVYSLSQSTCTAAKGTLEGVREKTGIDTGVQETRGTSATWRGRFVATMENGDKVFYDYEGSGSSDPSAPAGNKWTIDGGTGKFKGLQGSGSCTGKRSADGTSTWECTGGYSAGK